MDRDARSGEPARPKRSTGLVLGKFLPPHSGHLHLIDEARKAVDELTILVCSLASEPIPGELRYRWMTELCPGATVIHVTDENPSYPEEHPDFWDIWVDTIRRRLPRDPDLVFTSEEYGEELARRLGARHVSVDPGRSVHPVSGTAIRNDPLANWEHIPSLVRPWYVRRIVITGSESTGKTTLAERLAQHYATCWTAEFGRVYLDRLRRMVIEKDIGPIARGQVSLEDESLGRANRILIQDTDLVSTVVYSNHYFETCPPEVKEALHRRPAHFYLLLKPDVPWVSDPQRDRPHLREEMHALFRQELVARGVTFVEIGGGWSEREVQAIAAIDRFLRDTPFRQG